MKRSGPPVRRTPLKATSGLTGHGGSALKRTPFRRPTAQTGAAVTQKSTPITRKSQATEPPDLLAARREVRARSRGFCEASIRGVCDGAAQHFHHRKLRRSGDHSAANGLDCCHACHTWIHGHPSAAYSAGLLVRQHDDPASIEVTVIWGNA